MVFVFFMLTIVCSLRQNQKLDLYILKLAMEPNSDTLIKFGKNVRELRKIKGFSQEELAHRAGLHRTYIGMIERAEKNITLLNINKLANAFDVQLKVLFENI